MARNLIILSSVLIVLVVEINVTLSQLMNGNLFDGAKDTLSGFSSVLGGGKGLPLGLDKKARKGLETVGLGKAADMVGFRSEEKEEDEEDDELESVERPNENDEETEDEESDFEEDEVEDRNQEDEEEEEEEDYVSEKESEGRKSRKGDKKGPLSSFTDRMGEMDDKFSDTFGMRTGVGRFTQLIGDNGYEDENGANDARKQSKSSHKGSKAESSASSNAESSASSKEGKGKSSKGKAEKWPTRTPTPSPSFFG